MLIDSLASAAGAASVAVAFLVHSGPACGACVAKSSPPAAYRRRRVIGPNRSASQTAPSEDASALLADLTDGRGADVVIEAVGNPATYRQALNLVRRFAAFAVVLVGVPHEREAQFVDRKLSGINLRAGLELDGVEVNA